MSDRPTFTAGARVVADDLSRLTDQAYHNHFMADGISSHGGMVGGPSVWRREWEWAKLQEDLDYASEASARLYRDPSDLTVYLTQDVKAPPWWVADDKTPSGDWVRVERHTPGIWYVVDPPRPRALVLKALINMGSGLATTDGTIIIDNVTIMQPHNAIMHNDPGTEVENTHSLDGDNNGVVYIEWNQEREVWEAVPLCPVT